MLRAVQSPTLYAYQKASVLLPSILIMTNMLNVGPKPATRGGGEWEPIKISSEIQTVGLYPENHPSPQAF